MEHFAFGIAHVALQLAQQSHRSSHRHILKHILLPVLSRHPFSAGVTGAVRLIPDLIHGHLALIALHELLHITLPTVHDRAVAKEAGIQVFPAVGI